MSNIRSLHSVERMNMPRLKGRVVKVGAWADTARSLRGELAGLDRSGAPPEVIYALELADAAALLLSDALVTALRAEAPKELPAALTRDRG